MDDRLIISAAQRALLEQAEELLEQLGEDASDLGQEAGARAARAAASGIGSFTGRFDPVDRAADPVTIGDVAYHPDYQMRGY